MVMLEPVLDGKLPRLPLPDLHKEVGNKLASLMLLQHLLAVLPGKVKVLQARQMGRLLPAFSFIIIQPDHTSAASPFAKKPLVRILLSSTYCR